MYDFDNLTFRIAIETTKLLINKQEELKNIEWTNGESNIDTEYSRLACSCCNIAFENIKLTNSIYNNIKIECNEPDINIKYIYNENDSTNLKEHISKIELKSSKSSKMPGSTIRKLDVNQPLIFCLRPSDVNGEYKLRCSQYFKAMGESDYDLFQDRTPRPVINFKKMYDVLTYSQNESINSIKYEKKEKNSWVDHYAKCAINRLSKKCQSSWQDEMVEKIINNFIINTSVDDFKILKIIQNFENLGVVDMEVD